MKLYAVRMIENCQPVGLFWAKDVSDLVVAIDFDDVMSPTRCEYLTIETKGALVWYDHEPWQLGEPPGEADDLAAFEQRVEQVRENISFDGSLFALIYNGEAQGSWQSFSAAAQADEVMAPAPAESEHRGIGVLRFPAPARTKRDSETKSD